MPAAALRWQLELFRNEGFTVLPLLDLVEAVESGRDLPPRTIALTVDDGYADFAANGAPLFLEFGVPVTMFLTTGFVDQGAWMWWDQLDAAIRGSLPTTSVQVDGRAFQLVWRTEQERRLTARRLAHHIEPLPTADRERVLRSIFAQLDWTPHEPPLEFSAMSWATVRNLEAAGIRFGAHTVTHPILALSDDAAARHEIQHSFERLATELNAPVPILAYPNGTGFTWGRRETEMARQTGLRAAVTMHPRFVTGHALAGDRFNIPRIAVPEDLPSFIQLAAGPEALRHRMRGWS